MTAHSEARESGTTIELPSIPELTTRVDLSGQVAIVTGAGGGLGLGIAQGLAQSGAVVVLTDVDVSAAQRAAQSLAAAGLRAAAMRADVTDEASVAAMVARVADEHGSVDVLINNAGISTNEIIEQTPIEAWRRVIDVDLTGAFICSKAVLPYMTAAGHGRIVSIGSVAAQRLASIHSASYTVAKAGLEAFTRHLGYEVAGRGVTVNVVAPGGTVTPRVAESMGRHGYEAHAKRVPRGRVMQTQDVMRTILFLVSDLAEMVCGQTIVVDGGELLGWTDTQSYFQRRGVPVAR